MNAPHSIRKAKTRPNNNVGYHSETMAGIEFRELRREDIENGFLEALAALTTVELDARTASDLFDRTPANQLTFVAHKGDRIVGTTSLLIDQKYIHSGGRVGHIEDVAVVPDFQRRGIGTALVKYAVEIARTRGCYKVILHCFSELSPFYQQLGFRDFNIGMRLDIPSGT